MLRFFWERRRRRGALAVAALLLFGLWPLPLLEVYAWETGAGPALAYEAPLLPGAGFSIRYRHSIFQVGVEERFRPAPQGFALVEVASTTEEIADYYAFPRGRLVAASGHWRLLPGQDLTLSAPLRIRATPLGRRSLVVGERCVPLAAFGEIVELRWRRVALARWLWSAAGQTIFGKDVPSTCPVPAIATVSTTMTSP